MTADVIPTAGEARTLTDRIKIAVEGAWLLIQQAYTSRAWAVLGYSSWDDYCTREFGTSRLRLPREERQEVVASLRDTGMSTRAIASAVGVDRNTVMSDMQVAEFQPPAHITGTDGKTYAPRPQPAPEPPTRPRAPRTDVVAAINRVLVHARDAATAAEQITRQHLTTRSEEAAAWSRDLSSSLAALQRLNDALMEASE